MNTIIRCKNSPTDSSAKLIRPPLPTVRTVNKYEMAGLYGLLHFMFSVYTVEIYYFNTVIN